MSFGAGADPVASSQAHLATSAPFRAGGRAPCPASYAGRRAEGPASCPGFLLPFGCRRSLFGHPFPLGGWASLTVGSPAPKGRAPTGFPRSARTSCGRGGCPLYPGDGGAHTDGASARPPPAASQPQSPCTPVQRPTTGASCYEASAEGSSCSPVRPSPRLWPWVEQGPLGFPRASHPAVAGDACRGGDRLWALPELRHHQLALLPT